jgi:hypothetical protein
MNTFVVFGTLRHLRSWHISCGISIKDLVGTDRFVTTWWVMILWLDSVESFQYTLDMFFCSI